MTHDLTTNTTFAELGIADDLVAVLAANGVEEPFPIQAMTIPDGLAGADVMGKAKPDRARRLPSACPSSRT